jgi:hypothetical protein
MPLRYNAAHAVKECHAMRNLKTTLYGIAGPLLMLPMMAVTWNDIGSYIRGQEFRNLLGEFIIQIFQSIAGAFIALFTQSAFGIFG